MFDLFRSRDKAVRYLLGGLLGIVALSMVVTLIPGYGTPSQNREMVVAEVGKDQITVRQVQSVMQNVVRSRRVPQEMIPHYVPQLIDQMITERAMAYQADRMGFRVSDEEVANAIRSMLPQMIGGGEFDRNLYTRYLQQQGLTVDEFERNIRTNLLLLRVAEHRARRRDRNSRGSRAGVSPEERQGQGRVCVMDAEGHPICR